MSETPQNHPVLRGPLVTLRGPHEADLDPLVEILLEPEVALWWVGYTPERVRTDFIEASDVTRIIEVDGQTAGAMFVMRGEDPEYPTTELHLFISLRFRGRSVGQEALALATRHEFNEGIVRVTLDPNVNNAAAIRSFERTGFVSVGVMRDYQVRPDGSLNDALLLDLTRSDFPIGPPLPDRF